MCVSCKEQKNAMSTFYAHISTTREGVSIMAIVRTYIDMKMPVPKDVIEEIEAAAKLPVVPDEDCPELSDKQLMSLCEMASKQK